MQEQRYSLCPACDACPEVVLRDREVLIGEPGAEVRLTAEQWDVLVEAVRSGQLGPIGEEHGPAADCACGCDCECC